MERRILSRKTSLVILFLASSKGPSLAQSIQDFLDAAIAGTQAKIEGKLALMNPNEPVKQHVIVF